MPQRNALPNQIAAGYDDLPQWHQSTISSFCDFMPNPRKSPANLGELGFEEAQPAPERKRRTTWAEFIRLHLAVLAGVGTLLLGATRRARQAYCAMDR
jgi:hypothetical protein